MHDCLLLKLALIPDHPSWFSTYFSSKIIFCSQHLVWKSLVKEKKNSESWMLNLTPKFAAILGTGRGGIEKFLA